MITKRKEQLINNSIKEYEFFKKQYDLNNFNEMKDIKEWLNHFKNIEIMDFYENDYIDYTIENEDYLLDSCISYYEEDNHWHFSQTFEIYDRKSQEYIVEDFITKEEYLKMIKEPLGEQLRTAVLDLKWYESNNKKEQYENLKEEIIEYLKEVL